MFWFCSVPLLLTGQELIGFVTAADVHRRETCLKQDAGGQVAPLADLAIGGDLLALGKLFETGS